MEITDFTIQELMLNIFIGIIIFIAMIRVALWFLDTIVGGLYYKLIKFIKDVPNRLWKRGKNDENSNTKNRVK